MHIHSKPPTILHGTLAQPSRPRAAGPTSGTAETQRVAAAGKDRGGSRQERSPRKDQNGREPEARAPRDPAGSLAATLSLLSLNNLPSAGD